MIVLASELGVSNNGINGVASGVWVGLGCVREG